MIQWPQNVVDAIARRRAVIVIGSGISANSQTDDGARPPTWGSFLEATYRSLGRRVSHVSQALRRYDYLAACDFLRTELGAGWADHLRNTFFVPRYRHSRIHEAIFNLDSRIVASLNFDRIYDSYATTSSDGTVVVKNYYDDDIRQVLAGNGRYILKPHGSIDTVPRLIFTLSDYARARNEHAKFYEMFNALLHTHTFVLLGCGLSDPDVQILFEDYKLKYDECPHYMTYPRSVTAAEMGLIQRTRGISILPYSSASSHIELLRSLEGLVILVNETREEIARSQDW